MKESWTYKKAGVDIRAGEKVVENIKKMVKITQEGHPIVGGIGGFSGIYENPGNGYLLAGCDGVGTKILIAQKMAVHTTVGIDLVAMVVNDLLVQGGRPLFFLDYIAVPRIDEKQITDLLKGITEGCRIAGCALLGGETAEMPGVYPDGGYDLAGFGVALAGPEDLLPKEDIKEGDLLLGLPSSGLHSNGFSLVRQIFFSKENFSLTDTPFPLKRPLGEELLEPTIIYGDYLQTLRRKGVKIKGLAHITGGGLLGNIPRVLPQSLSFNLDYSEIHSPPIFELIGKLGNIDRDEMYSTFNMGIGMVAIIDPSDKERALLALANTSFPPAGGRAAVIGKITANESR